MADDGATRTRRWKLHKAGDHSECRRCDAVRGRVGPATVLRSVELPGPEQDDAVSATLDDPQAALQRQATRLEAACKARPGTAPLERELRATLLALRGPARQAD